MRLTKFGFGLTPTIFLFLAVSAQAGLVHRQSRNGNAIAASAPLLSGEGLIPVQIIQDGQQLETVQMKMQTAPLQPSQSEPLTTLEAAEIPAFVPIVIAEQKAESIETAENAENANSLRESERKQDEHIIEEEIKQSIVDENRELLQAAATSAEVTSLQTAAEPEQLLKQTQAINTDFKSDEAALEAAAAYFSAPVAPVAAEELKESEQLKSESLVVDNLETAAPHIEPTKQLTSNEPNAEGSAAEASSTTGQVRQAAAAATTVAATQATPAAQTTTQTNFVQQLIQNSPLGQFFGQLTGQQQQQQLASPGVQVAADQPATPAPTLPGFLNPQNAITQVQNAAQTVANATAQAFQGVQQFANNLGSQFQSTLSSLGGQQAQQVADSTTPRPPGPIQSLLNNFVGGNPPAAAAAAAAGATTSPAQQQGPFQGIITFLQGGNRPQGGAAVAAAPIAAAATTVDNKVDGLKNDEPTDAVAESEQSQGQEGGEEIDQSANEVRNSAEVGSDSQEDSNTDQLIVVDDDASQQERKVKI